VFQCSATGLHSGASTYTFENAPIVVDGVMYVTGWDGWVWAIDAKTGQELWRYKHASPFDVSLCCGNVNRGCAVAEGKVYVTTLTAHVLALDAETGNVVWDQVYGDARAGESATVAPLIVKDMTSPGRSVRLIRRRARRRGAAPRAADVRVRAGHGRQPRVRRGALREVQRAERRDRGELLWQFQCGSGHHSSPTTYSVDERQYIAVPTGWGGWAEGFLPAMLGARHGSALFAFALPE
jgi:glucose dehydrogenase